MSGQYEGPYAISGVGSGLSGVTVSGTAASGDVIVASSASAASWETLAAAGIANLAAGTPQVFQSTIKAYTLATPNSLAASSVSGTLASDPPTSHTVTAALGALTLGTAFENTLSYDVRVTIGIVVTAATAASFVAGVGSTTTPTQDAVMGSFSVAGEFSFSFVIPTGQYLLLSSAGTITVASVSTFAQSAV